MVGPIRWMEWAVRLVALSAIVALGCGDDAAGDGDDGDEGYAKVPDTGGKCQTGANDSPSETCECPDGWRTCKDGKWSECICPESGGCGDILEWICCEDEPDEYRLPCKGDESVPICECERNKVPDAGLDAG